MDEIPKLKGTIQNIKKLQFIGGIEMRLKQSTIIQGERIELELDITFEATGRPFPLDNINDIQFCIFDVDGNVLEKTLAGGAITIIGNTDLGQIKVILEIADTKLIAAKETRHSFDVEIDKSTGEHRIAKFENALLVESRICA